ncbi:MAG: virulence factor [Pseudomonadota bacterium]
MAEITAEIMVVWWRDIPAQIIAGSSRRDRIKRVLSERFEKAIDRAAMRAGARDSEAYLRDWHRVAEQIKGSDLQQIVEARALELEQSYDDARLTQLVARGGRNPDQG